MRRTRADAARQGPVAGLSKPATPSHPHAIGASADPVERMLFLQRTVGNQAVTSIRPAVRAPGRPLEAATRALMERGFGRDLSQVRVHTDRDAAESAAAIHAEAYTVGQDVVFGEGQYAPDTTAGRELLAHELTHTIQQRDDAGPVPSNDPSGVHETSARHAASNVAAGQPVQAPMPSAAVGVSMNGDPEREFSFRPTTLSLINPDPLFEASQVTDEMIEAPLKEFKEREKEEKERKQIVEEALDETRPERFRMFRQVLGEHGYAGQTLAAFMSKNLPMRDLLVLRRYGLEWARWYNRHKFQNRVKAALDRYLADQHEMKYGSGPVMKEFTQEDEAALRKKQYREEFYKAWLEGLPHVTGSVSGGFGAWVTSQFTDDPKKITAGAKMGTAFSGATGALVAKPGSYAPEAEQPYTATGMWRYKGPAPTKDVEIPKTTPPPEAEPPLPGFPQVDLSQPFQVPVEMPTPAPQTTTAKPGRTAAPDDVLSGFIARLGETENPFSLHIGERRAQKIMTGERDFALDTPVAFDVDEPLAVGAEGIKRQRAVDRALDPHNRQLLDPPTNRQTKHVRESEADVARHKEKRDEVSLLNEPSAVFTLRFDEVTELLAIFREAVARVRNPGSLTPTGLKNAINKNIREIIRDGRTREGRIVREVLRQLGFEYVENRGFVAVSR